MGSGAVCFRDPTETSGGKGFDQMKHPPRLVLWARVCVCLAVKYTVTKLAPDLGLRIPKQK